MFVVNDSQKFQRELSLTNGKSAKIKVASEFAHAYNLTDKTSLPATQAFDEVFRRNDIAYKPAKDYRQFSIEIERIFPSLDYYKIRVELAHFSLTLSAAKFPQSNKIAADICGNFGIVSFVELGKQALCLKSFSFTSHSEFQLLFPTVVKEWAILRICSALGCAPYMPNQLGFDLLIFENCIQYGTEKGEGIAELSSQDAKHLRQQLDLMHSFKIVHLDIKPENIVFSRHFGKAVFIDFGFSCIIEEQIGFKTLTIFKGTPKFCSPQMLSLMLEIKGFIDLYHSDVYGLQHTINIDSTKSLLVSFEQEDSYFKNKQNIIQTTIIYAIYAFQYWYIHANENKARQLLQFSPIFSEENAKRILQFIKTAARFIFIRQIFQDLRKYSFMIEYREIEEQLKQNTGKFFYESRMDKPANAKEENDAKPDKFNLLFFRAGPEVTQSFQHYLSILLNLSQLEDKTATNFVAIAFQCVRFDVRNLEVSEKKQIADKMNNLLLKKLQRNMQQFTALSKGNSKELPVDEEREALKPIKLLFLLIFEFCLARPQQSKWVKKHIFDITQQIILVDEFLPQHIDNLAKYVEQNFTQPKQKLLAMFQYSRLYDTINIIDTIRIDEFEITQNMLKTMMSSYLWTIMQSSQQGQELVIIRSILKQLIKIADKQSNLSFSTEQIKIKSIQELQIRKHMVLLLTKRKLSYYLHTISPEGLFNILQTAKRSSELQALDFVSLSVLFLKTLKAVHNQTGIGTYCKYMSRVINCTTIFHTLQLRQPQVPIFNFNIIQNTIRTFILKHQHSLGPNIYELFSFFVLIEKAKLPFENVEEQYINLYSLYKKYKQQVFNNRQSDKDINQQIVNIYFCVKMEFFFFQASANTQDAFINNLQIALEEYSRIKTDSSINQHGKYHYNLMLSSLNINFYQLYYHIFLNKYQICLACLSQIQIILTNLRYNSLLLEILRLGINLAVKCRKMDAIEKSVHSLYNFCCSINYIGFYFIPLGKAQLYYTLIGFEGSNLQYFYKLLYQLINFLNEHPVKQYFQSLIIVLDVFLAKNRPRGFALHYNKFISIDWKCDLKRNPYLLILYAYSLLNEETQAQLKLFKIIVLYCDALSTFARKKILQRSFDVYFRCLKGSENHNNLFIFRKIKLFIVQDKRKRIMKGITKTKFSNKREQKKLRQHIHKYMSYLI